MVQRIRRVMQVVSAVVRKVLMTVFLMALYVTGFGLTALFLRFFKRALLVKGCVVDNARWVDASGYDADHEDVLQQS
ncbi:MAG: hypothetical protein V2A70_04535 [Candidatus Omnitrophota bacterium]